MNGAFIISGGQCPEDEPDLVGSYADIDLAKAAAPVYRGVIAVDLSNGDIWERRYRGVWELLDSTFS
jgi:hypothetical protein